MIEKILDIGDFDLFLKKDFLNCEKERNELIENFNNCTHVCFFTFDKNIVEKEEFFYDWLGQHNIFFPRNKYLELFSNSSIFNFNRNKLFNQLWSLFKNTNTSFVDNLIKYFKNFLKTISESKQSVIVINEIIKDLEIIKINGTRQENFDFPNFYNVLTIGYSGRDWDKINYYLDCELLQILRERPTAGVNRSYIFIDYNNQTNNPLELICFKIIHAHYVYIIKEVFHLSWGITLGEFFAKR